MLRHARLRDREQFARVLATIAEREHQAWHREHPNATTLEQLAEIYRRGSEILRRGEAS